MAIWDAITRPIRGVGRLLRGKFKEGIGDIGAGVKGLAAPALAATGVGLPAAALIGAGGGAAEAWGGGGDASDVLKGAAGGVARAGAGSLAGKYLGGGAPSQPSLMSGERALAPLSSGSAVAPPSLASRAMTAGKSVLDAGKGVASWAEAHPTLAGAGVTALGEYQQGAADDKMAKLEEDDLKRRWNREDNMDPLLADLIRRLIGGNATIN